MGVVATALFFFVQEFFIAFTEFGAKESKYSGEVGNAGASRVVNRARCAMLAGLPCLRAAGSWSAAACHDRERHLHRRRRPAERMQRGGKQGEDGQAT